MTNHISNQLPSELFRLAAKDWVAKDGAARMLEESKTAVLSQHMKRMGDIPVSSAEREVKASPEWRDYLKQMVDARTAANLAKVKLKYIEMKYFEEQGQNASRRAEMRMAG